MRPRRILRERCAWHGRALATRGSRRAGDVAHACLRVKSSAARFLSLACFRMYEHARLPGFFSFITLSQLHTEVEKASLPCGP
eukprot:6199824-Pleurochrysis_carterae.AAC.1